MKFIRITALVLAIQTTLWIILLILSTSGMEPDWEAEEYLNWAAERGTAYTLNYINVSLLTLGVVFLFGALYRYLQDSHRNWIMAGLLLVPIYSVLNVLAYSLQISIVPTLAERALLGLTEGEWVAQLIQANPESVVAYANGLAYAILGIPSIIYGALLIRKRKPISGYLLLANGVLCLVGIIGYFTGNTLLGMGMVAGGILFLLSLGAMVWEFRSSAA